MINTLNLSNILFNKILIGKQFFFFYLTILLSFKFNEQCLGHSKTTYILSYKTKENIENVSKEPSNASVMNKKNLA